MTRQADPAMHGTMSMDRMLIRRCRSLSAVRFDPKKLATTEASTGPHNSPGAEAQAGAGQKPVPGLEFVSL